MGLPYLRTFHWHRRFQSLSVTSRVSHVVVGCQGVCTGLEVMGQMFSLRNSSEGQMTCLQLTVIFPMCLWVSVRRKLVSVHRCASVSMHRC